MRMRRGSRSNQLQNRDSEWLSWSSVYARTLVWKKLRADMNLVAVESPPTRVPLTFRAQAAKFGDVRFGIAIGGQALEVFPDELVEALAE